MSDDRHILHACSDLTCYRHHTLLQGSGVMEFAWELIQTYWSINVTEPRSELLASDQIRKLQLAAAMAAQN